MPTPPIVKSFLIADTVLQDRATGKWSVVGIFDRIFAPVFPCTHPTLAIYVKLSDAQGRYLVRVEFRDADDNRVSAIEGINLEVSSRLAQVEFGVPAQGLPLKVPGSYQFQLYLNDVYAASAPLEVSKVEAAPPRPQP